MRLLNSKTVKLDHLLTIEQSCDNRYGLEYTSVGNHVATSSKIVFVKVVPPMQGSHVSGKIFNLFHSKGKVKRFILICHYCKCFKYLNAFKRNKKVESVYKPRNTPKVKIDLKKSVKKI